MPPTAPRAASLAGLVNPPIQTQPAAVREPAAPPITPSQLTRNDFGNAAGGLSPLEPQVSRHPSPPLASQQPAPLQPVPQQPAPQQAAFDDAAPLTNFAELASATPPAPRPGDPALEGRQQPSLAMQKFAPTTVQVGKSAKFIIKVRNDSPRAIANVVVNDHTPAGSRLVSTTPTAQTQGQAISWQLGVLGAGEQRTLEMEIVPTEEGEIGSVATVTFSSQASVKAISTRPLLALRMTAPGRVQVGQQQRMQIEVHNPGTGDATNVVLVEDVPDNLRHEAGPSVEFNLGTLKAGETRQLELVMDAAEPGQVSNVLVARADGDLQVEQRVDFEVVAPSLAIAVDGPKRRFLQRPATYKVRVNNPGTAAARDIRLVTHLPRGMRFVKANNLGEYDASTHAVYWALAELPEGAGGEVQVTALPTTAGEMTIQAEGKAQSGLHDKVDHEVRVEGIAAIGFEVLDIEDPIEVGGQTEYEVRVDNKGTKEATGVVVRFVAPPGMRVLSANGPTQHAIDARGVSFEPLRRLAPRGESRYRVRVQADEPGDLRMTVEVTTDDLAQPVRKEEATRVFGDE